MTSSQTEPTYTVFIRLPFPRGDFVDPPPVNWDTSKDEELWKVISNVSKTEIDWNEIAAEFEVTVDFLLQQVAWLTDRHTTQLKAQMRKAAAAAKRSTTPSPLPGAESPLTIDTAKAAQHRATSSLTARKDSPLPQNEGSVPNSPRPTATRTSSSNTAVVTTRNLGGSSRAPARTREEPTRRRLTSLPISPPPADDPEPDPPSPGPADTSSGASSSSSSPAQSRIIRRPPRFKGNEASMSLAEDEDEEEEALAFLPQQDRTAAASSSRGQHDLSATLRGEYSRRQIGSATGGSRNRPYRSHTSDSSASSAARPSGGARTPSGPLSPRGPSELAGRSPAGSTQGKGYSRDNSDGTPSMGSSFSDLEDASVTQSALEEALASNMGDGGTMVGSLRGTLTNAFAFRSRYTPRSNNQ